MHDAQEFLKNLALVVGVAALTSVVFQYLRQPVVLGYIIAGLIIGPHVPVPLVADRATIQTLSELGVILLMFSIGLEFSLRKLLRVGPTAGLVAIVQVSIMLWLGFLTGWLFGWTTREALFAGAIVAISSTTIIAKAFDEQQVKGKLRELVFGILIVEDLLAVLLLATLTTLATGQGASADALAATTGRLAAILVAILAVGILLVPRLMRAIVRLGRAETTLMASIGLCFGAALLAHELGYSVALGAFIAGSLIAESGEERTVVRLIEPVRDMFAAIFFVAVGMLIDPHLVAEHWRAVAVLTLVVIIGKVVSVALGAFFTGSGVRTSIQAGMSLAQIGEFSFIIAALGLSLGVIGEFLYPVAVAVSALTTLSTPWLIRASGSVASMVDRVLPKPLQTFVALYGAWVEQLRAKPRKDVAGARVRRLVRLLLLDTALLAAVVVGTSVFISEIAVLVEDVTGIHKEAARIAVIGCALALAAPFLIGLSRIARGLGLELARSALPETHKGKVDLAAAPRRALVVTLQLAIVLLIGTLLVAVTQPFLPPFQGAVVLIGLMVLLGVAFWKSATNLHGHVRAGTQMIVEVLAAQAKGRAHDAGHDLEEVHIMLPGLGTPVPVTIGPGSAVIGKTLAGLDLRGLTGATVLAITRATEAIVFPTAREVLQEGDVLALAGSQESIEAARQLLAARPQPAAG